MITVVHSVRSWLPRTMTWLYTQVTRLPDGITSQVVCEQTENLDEFPLPGVRPWVGAIYEEIAAT